MEYVPLVHFSVQMKNLILTDFFSVGYTSRDVIYRWNQNRQVAIAEDMKLSQFDLIATPAANHTDTVVSITNGHQFGYSKVTNTLGKKIVTIYTCVKNFVDKKV